MCSFVGVLFRLVGAASDEELPPIYGIFVNTKKEHRRRVLQTELERVARLIPCRLTLLLFAFEFKAQNEDNLERGLQPFVSIYSGEQSLHEKHQSMRSLTWSSTDKLHLPSLMPST